MITTHFQKLVNAGLLVLDDVDEGYFSSYIVQEGYILTTKDGERITCVQIIHDEKDAVVVITEACPDLPLNSKWAQPITIGIYKEVDTIGWPL